MNLIAATRAEGGLVFFNCLTSTTMNNVGSTNVSLIPLHRTMRKKVDLKQNSCHISHFVVLGSLMTVPTNFCQNSQKLFG